MVSPARSESNSRCPEQTLQMHRVQLPDGPPLLLIRFSSCHDKTTVSSLKRGEMEIKIKITNKGTGVMDRRVRNGNPRPVAAVDLARHKHTRKASFDSKGQAAL